MVRCFVGIMLPENIKEGVVALHRDIAERLGELKMKCKFVEPETMHICLSFLGEVDEGEIEELKAKIEDVAARYKNFVVNVGKVKFVPSENYIRVIVLDVTDESGVLKRIGEDIVKAVGGDSKPPHLTLCRVKYVENKKKLVRDFGEVVCNKSFPVDSIQLIKSELRKNGPIYTVLHEGKLS